LKLKERQQVYDDYPEDIDLDSTEAEDLAKKREVGRSRSGQVYYSAKI
jgi:hypothetical protein